MIYLSPPETMVLTTAFTNEEPVAQKTIVDKCSCLRPAKVVSCIMLLEIKGVIRRLPGYMYERIQGCLTTTVEEEAK